MTKSFTALEKYAEATRECGMRKSVYPKWVAAGRMKQEEADRKLAVMEEIAAEYAEAAEKEPAGPLFAG